MVKIGMLIADRYEIVEKIGTGGMSDVYKAKDHKLNRFVAVKVLKQEFSENANFVSKFRVEAQAAAGLIHPNIVNVYDVGEEKGLYYIVMELVEGITLKKYIEKKARLSVKEAISIAIQVSMGLEAAHHNHVIHRDIKPQNIIISKDGKVKVADFGIAKAATSNTITSNVMGSVHYTSPEQARGGYSDEKSDIYSLGITLFEMLTGRVPFNGETTVAIAIKHIQQPMPSPCEFVPEIPHSVEQIVLKCCEKSPDRRYQSMEELIADLKESLLHPDDDFVRRVDPDQQGATRMASNRDYQNIRRGYEDDEVPEAADEPDRGEMHDSPRGVERNRARVTQNGRPVRNSRNGRDDYRNGRGDRTMRLERDELRDYDGDEYEEDRGSSKMEHLTTVLAIIAALLIGCIVIFLAARALGVLPGSTAGTETAATAASGASVMPDVTGQDAETAKTTLTALGLDVQTVYNDSDTVASGKVISTDIKAGQPIESGKTVTMTVSAGENGIAVPNVVGLSRAEAKTKLEQTGFKVNIQEQASDTIDEDTVISQQPTESEKAPTGSVITLTVSSGPDTTGKVQMPTVTGMSEEDALAVLTESKLKLGNVTEVTNADANLKGLVCKQSVDAGTYVDEGTAVDVEVSKGTEETTYYYTADIAAPTADEDANYQSGTQVYIVIIASDGTQLLSETVTAFPVHVSYTNLTASGGTLQMTYMSTSAASVTTDPDTGATVTVPGTSQQKTITRQLTFTAEN